MKKNLTLCVVMSLIAIFASAFASARPVINVDSIARTQRIVLDISRYQGPDINFEKVKESSKWIYIKATEGMNIDPLFISNIKRAKDAKLHVGAYCFFSEKSGARDQANFFIKTVKSAGVDLDLIPVLDVERLVSYEPAQLRDSIAIVLQVLQAEFNCKPMIYSGARFFLDYLQDFKDYPLWIARYNDVPPDLGDIDYILLQWTDSGKVSGIDNSLVDVSFFVGNHRPREIKLPSKSQDEDKKASKSSKKGKKKGKGSRKHKNVSE